MFAVGKEAGLFPGIPQEVAGDGHFRKDNYISMVFFGFVNHAQHGGGVFIGMPGDDFHLGHSYF